MPKPDEHYFQQLPLVEAVIKVLTGLSREIEEELQQAASDTPNEEMLAKLIRDIKTWKDQFDDVIKSGTETTIAPEPEQASSPASMEERWQQKIVALMQLSKQIESKKQVLADWQAEYGLSAKQGAELKAIILALGQHKKFFDDEKILIIAKQAAIDSKKYGNDQPWRNLCVILQPEHILQLEIFVLLYSPGVVELKQQDNNRKQFTLTEAVQFFYFYKFSPKEMEPKDILEQFVKAKNPDEKKGEQENFYGHLIQLWDMQTEKDNGLQYKAFNVVKGAASKQRLQEKKEEEFIRKINPIDIIHGVSSGFERMRIDLINKLNEIEDKHNPQNYASSSRAVTTNENLKLCIESFYTFLLYERENGSECRCDSAWAQDAAQYPKFKLEQTQMQIDAFEKNKEARNDVQKIFNKYSKLILAELPKPDKSPNMKARLTSALANMRVK